jgi:hypothetical protein
MQEVYCWIDTHFDYYRKRNPVAFITRWFNNKMNHLSGIKTVLQTVILASLCKFCSAQKISVYKIDLAQTEGTHQGYRNYTCTSSRSSQLPFVTLLVPIAETHTNAPTLWLLDGEYSKMQKQFDLNYSLYGINFDSEFFMQVSQENQFVLSKRFFSSNPNLTSTVERQEAINFMSLLDQCISSSVKRGEAKSLLMIKACRSSGSCLNTIPQDLLGTIMGTYYEDYINQDILKDYYAFKASPADHWNTYITGTVAFNKENKEWEYWLVISSFTTGEHLTPCSCFAIQFDKKGFMWLDDTAEENYVFSHYRFNQNNHDGYYLLKPSYCTIL